MTVEVDAPTKKAPWKGQLEYRLSVKSAVREEHAERKQDLESEYGLDLLYSQTNLR